MFATARLRFKSGVEHSSGARSRFCAITLVLLAIRQFSASIRVGVGIGIGIGIGIVRVHTVVH